MPVPNAFAVLEWNGAGMSFRRLAAIVTLALVASVVTLAGCGVSESTSSAPLKTTGYPNSIAVLGHSGATGENSDPQQPGVEVRANSWATGTNPKVNSVYRRVLAHNPAIKGHNVNYARAGADVRTLADEASVLLGDDPKPDLILIQIMDNDLTCPVEPAALSDFRTRLTATLKKLGRGAPKSSQFVMSQLGSPLTYARSISRQERASQGGTGPCDFMTPAGKIARKKVVRAEEAIHAYEAALKSACATVRQCTYDGGAFGRVVDRREYVTSDLNHLTIAGHAKAAAVAWAALRRTGVLGSTSHRKESK
jgi:hypothetical protein